MLVPGATIRVARTLGELHACLKGEAPWPDPPDPPPVDSAIPAADEPLDLADVLGLEDARRALAVAAAGAHHLLMVGPPGVGKTMLARRLPTILAPLDPDEALEVTKIHSAAGTHRGPALRMDAAPPASGPGRSASRTAALSSSTSCPSSRSTRSKRCGSRSRNGSCA
jgi:magnesium chelatase family protein